jgi:catechol 2,3-dioxygenase-like lactoylglutathione lyase family enzyme
MALQRIDHTGLTVTDLDAAIAFLTEIGMELMWRGGVEGPLVGRIIGLEGAASEVAMLEAPGGTRIELSAFKAPLPEGDHPHLPVNVPGMRHLCFAVDDLRGTLSRLEEMHGAELIGEVVDYEGAYLLCYLRGPDGIIVELAEKLG